jgi:hypothetical protein
MAKPVLRYLSGDWTPIRIGETSYLELERPPVPLSSGDVKRVGFVLDRSTWLEVPMGRWMAAYRLTEQQGQPVISELRIFPFQEKRWVKRPGGRWSGMYGDCVHIPGGGITARLIRQIKLTEFRKVLCEILDRWKHLAPHGIPVSPSASPSKPHRGRKGRSDIELARIASIYEGAYLARRAAISAVARALNVSLSKARDAVHRARIRGILSAATKQGRGGGTVTPLGRQLLKKQTKGGRTHGKKR